VTKYHSNAFARVYECVCVHSKVNWADELQPNHKHNRKDNTYLLELVS
jgi:hypothetical protein